MSQEHLFLQVQGLCLGCQGGRTAIVGCTCAQQLSQPLVLQRCHGWPKDCRHVPHGCYLLRRLLC